VICSNEPHMNERASSRSHEEHMEQGAMRKSPESYHQRNTRSTASANV
jgi:hypothetical protein